MQSSIFQAIRQAFAQAGWQAQQVEGEEVLLSDFEAHHTRLRLHVQAFAEIGALSVVVESANPVSQEKCAHLAELLMRGNEQLSVGNFEMLWDEGLALFRSTNLFSASQLEAQAQTPAQGFAVDVGIIQSMVHSAVAEMDRMTPFIAILEGTPAEELAGMSMERLLRREDLLPPHEADTGLLLGEDAKPDLLK